MPLDLLEIEADFADPYVLQMVYNRESVPLQLVLRLEMGAFDHFEPLWRFLRSQGVENLGYSTDFFISPTQIIAAHQIINSLWPEIQRTKQFFHTDDEPFWTMRDTFERLTKNGGALVALCD